MLYFNFSEVLSLMKKKTSLKTRFCKKRLFILADFQFFKIFHYFAKKKQFFLNFFLKSFIFAEESTPSAVIHPVRRDASPVNCAKPSAQLKRSQSKRRLVQTVPVVQLVTISTWRNVSTVVSARRRVRSMRSSRDRISSIRLKLTRSCCTTRRNFCWMETVGNRNSLQIFRLNTSIAEERKKNLLIFTDYFVVFGLRIDFLLVSFCRF